MKKHLVLIFLITIISISGCFSTSPMDDVFDSPSQIEMASPRTDLDGVLASVNTNTDNSYIPEISFTFLDKIPLFSEPAKMLEQNMVKSILFSQQLINPDITQGFYRKRGDNEPQNIYSFIEIDGIRYDIGKVTYGGDNTFGNGFDLFQFVESNVNSDNSVITIYQQYKIYGAAYDATAYYTIENGVPILQCEISGVVGYSDYDESGVISVLSTDSSMPYNEYKISKLDLVNNTLEYTSLTELLDCDGIYYEAERGWDGSLFFTFHKPSDSNSGSPEDGGVYSFYNSVFILRYTPVSVSPFQY